jgi:hypothetical protein
MHKPDIPLPPPTQEVWPLERISRRWQMPAVLADSVFADAGIDPVDIPRRPVKGYPLSAVLALEEQWRAARKEVVPA